MKRREFLKSAGIAGGLLTALPCPRANMPKALFFVWVDLSEHCAAEPKAGRQFASPTSDRSAFEFARFACDLAMQYPAAKTVHLVMDNLNTHRRQSLTEVFGEDVGGEIWDRFTVHYTLKHGSWLN